MSERNERSNKNNSGARPREMRPRSGDVTLEAWSVTNAKHKSEKNGSAKTAVQSHPSVSATSSVSDWETASRRIIANGAVMDRKAMPLRSATDRPKTRGDLAVYSTTENKGERHKSSAHRARSQCGSSTTSKLNKALMDDTFFNVSKSHRSTVSAIVGTEPVKSFDRKLEYTMGATLTTKMYRERSKSAGDPKPKIASVAKQLPSSAATVPSGAGAKKPWAVKESTFERVYCLSNKPLEPDRCVTPGGSLNANSLMYKLYCVPPKC